MSEREDFFAVVSDLALGIQAAAVYPESHQRIQEILSRLHRRLQSETDRRKYLHIGLMADHVVVEEFPFLGLNPTLQRLIRRLLEKGMEKIVFREGITLGELKRFVYFVGAGREAIGETRWEFIAFGKIQGGTRAEEAPSELVSMPDQSNMLHGATDVLKDVLVSLMEGDGKGSRVSEGRDIVNSVMKGLRQEELFFERLMNLQSHDDYTLTHSLNVCVIVMAQAAFLDLPENLVQEIGLAALLHDIGKEMIPSEILNKPGKLDKEEFLRMTDHPVLGAKTLRKIDCGTDLPMIVAFEHHIRYNRSGYPKTTLTGPLHPASYLTQIADVYDALRTYRPYRKSVAPELAFSMMLEGRGTEFEPQLFDKFVELLT